MNPKTIDDQIRSSIGGYGEDHRNNPPMRTFDPDFIRMDLRPKMLTRDVSLTALRKWRRKFTAYFGSSNFAADSIPGQQAVLFSVIDGQIMNYVDREIDKDTPVFAEKKPRNDAILAGAVTRIQCCMDVVKQYFDEKYPLLNRRLDLFTMVQLQGEPFSAFCRRIQVLAEECDLGNLTQEDIMVISAINGSRSNILFELRKEPEIKWKHIKELAHHQIRYGE